MRIKVVSFYYTYGSEYEIERKLVSLISKIEPDHKSQIINYLNHGLKVMNDWGMPRDVLHPEKPTIPDADLYTDGIWAWTGEVPYYVKMYNLALPEEFLRHMEALEWKTPSIITRTFSSCDFESFWTGKPLFT